MTLQMARSASAAEHRMRSAAATAFAFGVLATLVAAAGSWIPSLWADEVTSVMSARRAALLSLLEHVDAVHGAYYAGLQLWGSIFGFSPFSVRLPSAIAVGFATAVVVMLADRLRSRRVAIIAGGICAVVPRVTYMGEEARSYAFSAAIVAWLTLLLIVALGHTGRSRTIWIVYALLLALGIYTFLYVALFVAVHAVVMVMARPSRYTLRAWAIATVAAIVAATPVVLYALWEHGQVAYLGSVEQLAPDTLFSALWFGQWSFAVIAWALVVVSVVFEVRRVRARRAAGRPRWVGADGLPSVVPVALIWLLLPTLVLIGMHAFVPDFTARYVSFCAPAAALLIACGLDDLVSTRRWLGISVGALCVVLVVPIYLAQRTPHAKNGADFAEISAAVGANARAGDAVVFDESPRPSHRPRLALYGYPAGFTAVRDVTLQTSYIANPVLRDEVYTVQDAAILGRFSGVQRVWLIEYALSRGHADTYGVRDLEALGYRPTATRIPTYRSLITLYERTP